MYNICYTDLEIISSYPKRQEGEFSSPHCCEELSLPTPSPHMLVKGLWSMNAKLTERSEPSSEHCLDLLWYIPPLLSLSL